MSKHWKSEILTSCAVEYSTWSNIYPAGDESIDDVLIRRFPVQSERDVSSFNKLSAALYKNGNSASPVELENWLQEQGPWCPGLIQYLSAHAAEYDAFIFFTYLYWPTVKGLPLVLDRAILAPLAHDEWTIHLRLFKHLFETTKHFIFNTIEERSLIQRLCPNSGIDGPIAGIAVDRPLGIDPLSFRRQYSLEEGFLLYLGRIDPSKGCEELFEFFQRSRSEGRTPKKLVLLGTSMMTIPDHPDILNLGFVSEQTKWNALAACDILIMPSAHESLSIVLLEAWSVAKPVIVNGRCAVLVGQCRRANGGLWYSSYEQWIAAVARLVAGRTASVLGRQGWRFVKENYGWQRIEDVYLNLVDRVVKNGTSAPTPS